MGNLEALGDAVTGGIVGRTVEPKAGEGSDGHTHETNCLNCGTPLSGPYCYECGHHSHVHRTLAAFFHDFLHGVLHFEGKIWRTLPLLAWKPGDLTRRYIDGQRASFISPVALFLFTVFLTFAIMGLVGAMPGSMPAAARQDVSQDLRTDQLKLTELQAKRAAVVKSGGSTAALDTQISDVQTEISALQVLKDRKLPANAFKVDPGDNTPGWLRDAFGRAAKNPELLFYKVKTNAYKFSWALIPISVPFVWLLFPFSRRFRLYDHTIFVTYSLCFMMLLLSVGTLVGLVSTSIAGIAWLIPPIHMYRQLRGTYGVSVFGAVWRAFALSIFAFIAISLFAALLVGVGTFD
jgi:hypothetical protein